MSLMKSWIKNLILLSAVKVILVPNVVLADTEVSFDYSNLIPHRAFYSLSMGVSEDPGRFVDVNGIVHAAIEKTCDGWITSEQIKMQVLLQSNMQWNQNLMYTGWESFYGNKYRFATHSSNNGKIVKYRGAANSFENIPGQAIYSEPKKLTMELPSGTQFSSGLTFWLIKKASEGARRAETIVFDGTDTEGPKKVISFITPFKNLANDLSVKLNSDLHTLTNRPGWKMHIAFYSLSELKAEPEYEVQALVLDNGVMPKLELVFSSFTAVQILEKIELIQTPK
jgi:hypothetical protein